MPNGGKLVQLTKRGDIDLLSEALTNDMLWRPVRAGVEDARQEIKDKLAADRAQISLSGFELWQAIDVVRNARASTYSGKESRALAALLRTLQRA